MGVGTEQEGRRWLGLGGWDGDIGGTARIASAVPCVRVLAARRSRLSLPCPTNKVLLKVLLSLPSRTLLATRQGSRWTCPPQRAPLCFRRRLLSFASDTGDLLAVLSRDGARHNSRGERERESLRGWSVQSPFPRLAPPPLPPFAPPRAQELASILSRTSRCLSRSFSTLVAVELRAVCRARRNFRARASVRACRRLTVWQIFCMTWADLASASNVWIPSRRCWTGSRNMGRLVVAMVCRRAFVLVRWSFENWFLGKTFKKRF